MSYYLEKRLPNSPIKLQCNAIKGMGITFQEIREIVANNNKQRFSLIPIAPFRQQHQPDKDNAISLEPSKNTIRDAIPPMTEATPPDTDDPSFYLIRANQGHSLASVETEDLLTPITLENAPEMIVHGTTAKAWNLILQSGGLKPMGRNHVHFASGIPAGLGNDAHEGAVGQLGDTASKDAGTASGAVISGMRNTSNILIYIDLSKAMNEGGLKFWRSENGVILCAGNEEGIILIKYFRRVENRKFKKSILENVEIV